MLSGRQEWEDRAEHGFPPLSYDLGLEKLIAKMDSYIPALFEYSDAEFQNQWTELRESAEREMTNPTSNLKNIERELKAFISRIEFRIKKQAS